MAQKLSEARRKLLEQSFFSGMAEMAAGVLHNIRNSLNPIFGYLHLLHEDLSKAPLEKIETAQKELSEGNLSEERKKDLIHYLDLSHQSLYSLVRKVKSKLGDLSVNATEIEKILAFQDKFSHKKYVMEKVGLYEMVLEAITMIPDDLSNNISFEKDPSLKKIGPMVGHRISLLEIFAKLLTNAAESIRRAGSGDGKIQISADMDKIKGEDMVHVLIYDNGEGIEPDNLNRIFERNFSTKTSVTSGFSLHWCANTITAMKGRIYAESKGKGFGACFHLLIPKNP